MRVSGVFLFFGGFLRLTWRPRGLSNLGFRVPLRGSFKGTIRVSGLRATVLGGPGDLVSRL